MLKSHPKPEFKLFKENKEIKAGDRFSIEKYENNLYSYSIHFKKIESSDIGNYKLVASNKCGSSNAQASLAVSGAPVINRKTNSEITAAEKKSIKFEFDVTGLPQPEIEWFVLFYFCNI
jgi:hypothetical protein